MTTSKGERPALIPVTVLTGFLGSGKTSLLNTLLKDPMLADACVIINEFGEIGLDHLLVETSGETIVELSSGCLCCTIRGELIDTLTGLLSKRDAGEIKPFNRIVIETTGLADPAPVLHGLMVEPYLVSRLSLSGVITVVDAVNGMATLDAHAEAVKQVAVSDRIVLTKLDLLVGKEGEDKMFTIIARLRRLAPGARMLTTHRGEATAERLLNTGLYDPATRSLDVQGWLSHENVLAAERADHAAHHGHHGGAHQTHDVSRHDAHIHAFAFTDDNVISPQGLELFLQVLSSYHGPGLLRMKGIIKVSDDPARPVVLHGVQHVMHPPARLPQWPSDDRQSRLVFIVKDIAKAEIEKLFRAFTDPLDGGAGKSDKTLSLN
jgi:G3E family GTPase